MYLVPVCKKGENYIRSKYSGCNIIKSVLCTLDIIHIRGRGGVLLNLLVLKSAKETWLQEIWYVAANLLLTQSARDGEEGGNWG